MNKLKEEIVYINKSDNIKDNYHSMYYSADVDYLINELSNIIFSLEQGIITNREWSRILRKDIKKIQQLRKKSIISSKYINE